LMKEPRADYSGFIFLPILKSLSTRLPDGQEGKGFFQFLK